MDALSEAVQKVGAAMYADSGPANQQSGDQSAPPGGDQNQAGANPGAPNAGGQGTVDADFKEVK